MDIGKNLKELNLSSEEMDRFTKAFNDGKFREMFCEYVQEISEPENKKKYEEEIRQLERERGNKVEFIQPTPFRVIKTSAAGKQKCFINICANDKIQKPKVKSAVSEDGRRGQCWTLPHSLHPGRTERDPKGNALMIYDVVFHPDTLHMASKNKAFMDMVNDTAIDGVQRAFKVDLDKINVRETKAKYKGTPQTCVIRRPIPGYDAQNISPALPCPELPQPQMESEGSPPLTNSRDFQQDFQSKENQEPAKPNYTVKYRSRVDVQDFRCSRDSVQSPRPKEILITIDLPLLKSVRDTSLEVKEKSLLLESKQPAYRLQLPLSYPVDEDKGEAKFNKHTGQLTVTLPVRPSVEAGNQSVGPCPPASHPQGDGEGPEEQSKVEQEQGGKVIYEKSNQEVQPDEQEEENHEIGKGQISGEEKNCQQMKRKQHETEEGKTGTELPNWDLDEKLKRSQVSKAADEEEGGQMTMKKKQSRDSEEKSALDNDYRQVGEDPGDCALVTASLVMENQDVFTSDERIGSLEEDKEAKLTSSLESTSKTTTLYLREGPGQAEEEASLQHLPPIEEPPFSLEASFPPAEAAESRSSVGGVSTSALATEPRQALTADTAEKGRETGEDDQAAHRVLQKSEQDSKPPAASSLWEIDADGKQTPICDHSTSAGFVFQNKLVYELD